MSPLIKHNLTEQLSPPESQVQRQLRTLIQVSAAIGAIHDTRELMTRIVEHISTAFDADRSSLFRHDADRGQLWTCIAQGLDEVGGEIRIPDDQGICGKVFQSHQPMLIDNAMKSPDFARDVAAETTYVPRSMLVVPIFGPQSRCMGVLQVMDAREGRFDDEAVELLEAIAIQVGICLENARLVMAQKRQFDSFVQALSIALEARDPITATHSRNVANYAVGIAHQMGIDRKGIQRIHVAGLLHDIGKIGVPEAVLTKPGKLTEEEYEQIKTHAAQSRHILEQIEFTEDLSDLAFVAAAHHEKLDGTGYPDGLTDQQIPYEARVLAVADVFDALTQDRHYRSGMPFGKAMSILDEMGEKELDTDCIEALRRFLNLAA